MTPLQFLQNKMERKDCRSAPIQAVHGFRIWWSCIVWILKNTRNKVNNYLPHQIFCWLVFQSVENFLSCYTLWSDGANIETSIHLWHFPRRFFIMGGGGGLNEKFNQELHYFLRVSSLLSLYRAIWIIFL